MRGRFTYASETGKTASVRRAAQIDALAIPPAWTDVHIATTERAAIQAWGFDARGRKQYRYHPNAVKRGQTRKYYRVRQMARDLPAIRRRIHRDFSKRKLTRERVTAGMVRFLSDGFFRIGNDRYARENGTFGLTTLKKSHVEVDGDLVVFDYIGKRSIRHRQTVVSRDLARFVQALMAAPGMRLFRYQDESGQWHNIESVQVNQYLQELAGFPYSAKDFRTWGGTLRAATVLADLGAAKSENEAKRNVATAVRLVAAELGNTPTICRKSYVHPVVIERYIKSGDTIQLPSRSNGRGDARAHTPEEGALIQFLDAHFPDRRSRRRTNDE
ncbi:MAG: DNA topoisomerase IB [Gemmatimonadota bacterium]|nr:DNA topoisomerase IB [Gemmatimonadota bacterium]